MTEGQTKFIRQWRVGSFSMGILLILLGIALFMGAFDQTRSIATMLKFWPVLLIMLGAELTALNILANIKNINYRLTYDFLSIFLVLLLTFGSAVLVVADSAGVLDLAQRSLAISQRYIEVEKVSLGAGDLDNVAITAQGRRVILRAYSGNDIKVTVIYRGYFASQEEGLEYANDQYVRAEREGRTLYVDVFSANTGKLPNNHVEQEVIILVPQHLDLALTGARGELQVQIQELQGSWTLNHQGQNMEVQLGAIQDLKLSVDGNTLAGNIAWDNQDVPAQKTWGQGSASLNIRSQGKVTITD